MNSFVITSAIGFVNPDKKEEFIEIKEIVSKRVDIFFLNKFNKKSNKIHIEG